MRAQIVLRSFAREDAAPVTSLLHRAYGRLARMGLRYWATHQSVEDTIHRASRGECVVAELDGRLAGTIALTLQQQAGGTPWYDRPEVATFGQFAVDPEAQSSGIGSRLLEFAEARAADLGARELACDTSDHATHLIAWYLRRGYRFIEHVDHRPHTNYCSVILSKALTQDHPAL